MSKIKDVLLQAEEIDSEAFHKAMDEYDMSRMCQIAFKQTEIDGKPALVNVR